ncbi:hypothetical protein BD779DRAFT_1447003 [Infundibulicybe gibba]|nr:hypothetical protein BD779DRAFT_1447003 [Infundibulicybe gibba]
MQADSISPNDSASQVQYLGGGSQTVVAPISSHGAPPPPPPPPSLQPGLQPAIRPAAYPESILWTIEDCRNDPMGVVSEGNLSRPKMDKCIRDQKGVPVTLAQWRAIRMTTRLIISQVFPLSSFEGDNRKKSYLKTYHGDDWISAIFTLERKEPLVALCAGHWKADQVLGVVLKAQQKKKTSPSEDEADLDDSDEDSTLDSRWTTTNPLTPASSKPMKHVCTTHHATQIKPKPHTLGSGLINALSREFPVLPHALSLLNAMAASPNFEQGQPSSEVLEFIARINDADPNTFDEESEDETNANWGHYQFTAGGINCRSVLTTWSRIGNTETACCLIAAALKTCRIARHICIKRGIQSTNFLSDAYLQNTIEILWELWVGAGGVHIFSSNNFVSTKRLYSPKVPPKLLPDRAPARNQRPPPPYPMPPNPPPNPPLNLHNPRRMPMTNCQQMGQIMMA